MVKSLVIASNNKHKLAEFRQILGSGWNVLSAQSVAPNVSWNETGQTFLANARIKVNALRPYTQLPILADDSGLCVDHLQGKPGVLSSSFGGIEGDHAANNARLLHELANVPLDKRTAYFCCLLLLQHEDGREFVCEGRCSGHIALQPVGGNGFGYDPLFVADATHKAMALLTELEKNAVSHRGRAAEKLMGYFEREKVQ